MAKVGEEDRNKFAEETGGRHSFHRCRVESALIRVGCVGRVCSLCAEAAFSLGFVRIQEVHGVPRGDE